MKAKEYKNLFVEVHRLAIEMKSKERSVMVGKLAIQREKEEFRSKRRLS